MVGKVLNFAGLRIVRNADFRPAVIGTSEPAPPTGILEGLFAGNLLPGLWLQYNLLVLKLLYFTPEMM